MVESYIKFFMPFTQTCPFFKVKSKSKSYIKKKCTSEKEQMPLSLSAVGSLGSKLGEQAREWIFQVFEQLC